MSVDQKIEEGNYLCRVSTVLSFIHKSRELGRPMLAMLVDPGKLSLQRLKHLLAVALQSPPDLILVGGSTSVASQVGPCIELIRMAGLACPVILFPGNETQVDKGADALLLLSLISGRNPDLLIGKHVTAAMDLHQSGLEIIPTGYILIESGKLTTVAYVSQTQPIPRDSAAIAVSTALAGQLLGMKAIYLEAGSGARWPVPPEVIYAVKEKLEIPLIVGGGIDSVEKMGLAVYAGADVIVVGNALESDPDLLSHLVTNIHAFGVREEG